VLRIVDACGRAFKAAGFDRSSAVAYLGESTDRFRVRAVDLGHGHIEASAVRELAWNEVDWSPEYLSDVMDCIDKANAEEDPAEARLRDRQRAARRAKTRVRRLCKVMASDTLLTLTYKGNQTDLDLCKRHLKAFNRRMLTVLPDFCMVACFEPQQRGAWHVHIATRGIPAALPGQRGEWRSFNVIRAIWRAVAGEWGGNIDLQRRKFNSQKSAAQVAAYIAKYIGKTFEEGGIEAGKNRWTKYGQVEVPETQDLGTVDTLREAIELTYGLLSDGQSVSTARLDRWQDWFFVSGEIRPTRRPQRA
jgi:hypothetical protein